MSAAERQIIDHPVAMAEQPPVASPLDLPAEQFRAGLDRRGSNRKALMEWVRSALVEGVDYGRIHTYGKSRCRLASQGRARECTDPAHWSKPSLFKPGAEKICGMLGVTVHYPTLGSYEHAALNGEDLQTVILRCEIHDASGRVVADGMGARSLAQDNGDLNKALKMAAKSAHIDATLRMAGLSEVFTQDLEDMRLHDDAPSVQPQRQPAEQCSRSEPAQPPEVAPVITQPQYRRLEARIRELGLDRDRVKRWVLRKWNVQPLKALPREHYDELDQRLNHWAQLIADEEARAEREAIQAE